LVRKGFFYRSEFRIFESFARNLRVQLGD